MYQERICTCTYLLRVRLRIGASKAGSETEYVRNKNGIGFVNDFDIVL